MSEQAAGVSRRAWLAVVAWTAMVGGGMAALANYSQQAGPTAEAPQQRTAAAAAEGDRARFQLTMFLHPRCPCSAASVAELARLLARCGDEIDVVVRFYRPANEADAWAHGRLWDEAAMIPGVRVECDADGRLAREYGAKTSGDVLLYDSTGRLRFHGGITPARGHEGDSGGKAAILAMVRGESAQPTASPVFGCRLENEGD